MAQLPDPLLLEIFQKLPLKSVFLSESVSKHWLSLISDPFFARSYTRNITTTNNYTPPWTLFSTFHEVSLDERAIIRDPELVNIDISLRFMIPVIYSVNQAAVSLKLLDSSKGLLLACSLNDDSQVLDYFVCNPLTKKWVGLPKFLSQPKWVKAVIMVDDDSGDYFVVRIVQLTCYSKVFNFEVFSSESSQWKYVKVCCEKGLRFFVMRRHTVCYNGLIHCLADNHTILVFDPRSDGSKCRLIDLPCDRVSRIVGVIGVSCGFMRYVEVADTYLEPTEEPSLGVWLLKDYDAGEWILEYRIELSEFCSSDLYVTSMFSRLGDITRAVAFHPFDRDIVYLNCSSHLICCQLSTKMVEVVECASDKMRDSLFNFEVFPFALPPWPTPISRKLRVHESLDPLLVELPDSMLMEILQKLPLKSIFCFKSVSKHWFSLISNPKFAKSYTLQIFTKNNYSPPCAIFSSLDQMGFQERVLMRDQELAHTNFSLQFLGPIIGQASTKLLDSSNGLLLLCSMSDSQILDYYVCNPLTMKWVCLPQPLRQPKWVKAAILVEKVSGNFLVVRVAELLFRSKVFNFEIFSSKLGEWRDLTMNCSRRIRFFVKARHTVCYNGMILWLVDNHTILAFDPEGNTNDCHFIDLPPDTESMHLGVLGVSCGLLCYMEVSNNKYEEFREQSLGVWTLKDYDTGEWCLECRIQLNEFWSGDDASDNRWDPDTALCTRPLGFHPFDFDMVFLEQGRRLYCCNVSTRVVKIVDCESHLNNSLFKFEMFPFVLPPWPTPVPQPIWETDQSAN